jgi:hypothetical protein
MVLLALRFPGPERVVSGPAMASASTSRGG